MPGDEGSTKHEPVGQYGTGYQHVVTQLNFTPVRYADYSGMLRAIEQAGSNILNYLNPKTIAQMKLDVASSNAGRKFLENASPAQLQSQGYVQGGQFYMQPAYENRYLAPRLAGPFEDNKTDETGKPVVDPHSVQPADNNQQNPPADQNPWWQKGVTTGDANTDALVNPDYSKIGPTPSYYQEGGPVQQPQQQSVYQPSYFAAPNPNNAIPPPPVPQQAQRSPMMQPSSTVSAQPQPGELPGHIPYSPEAQNQILSQQTSGVPLNLEEQARRQAEQQNLIQWQNTNQGGVMSALEAKNWAQNNLDTDISRAVYLPHGGPAGPGGMKEPAFAFYGRKGGSNIVPISQMVKAGAGPLVAAQNTSQVLHASDQQQQQIGQQPPGQQQPPPNAMAGANMGMGGAPPQGNMPPAAPGGAMVGGQPPQQDPFARAVAAATNIPATGGPQPNQLIASANGAGQVQTQTTDPEGNPVRGNLPTNDEMESAKHRLELSGVENAQKDADGNPSLGRLGDFQYYRSENGKGLPYTDHEGEEGYYRDRLWWGDTQWKRILPNADKARQDLLNTDYGKSLGKAAIDKMDAQQLSDELYGQYYLKNILPMQPNMDEATSSKLELGYKKIMAGTRLIHAMEGQNGEDFNWMSQGRTMAHDIATGLNTRNPKGLIPQAGNLIGTGLAGLFGPREASTDLQDRQDFVQAQEKRLINLMQNRPESSYINPLDLVSGDRTLGAIGFGRRDALSILKDQVNQWRLDWNHDMLVARANKARMPGAWNDLMNDANAGKEWWDPDDRYDKDGNKRTKQVPPGKLALADTAHQNAPHRLEPLPNVSPAPAAPSPTPVRIHSDKEYYALPNGTEYIDGKGNRAFKGREGR